MKEKRWWQTDHGGQHVSHKCQKKGKRKHLKIHHEKNTWQAIRIYSSVKKAYNSLTHMKIQLTLFWMRNMFHSHKHDFYLQTDKYLRNWILHLLDDHYYKYIKLKWRKPEKYLKFTITYFYHLSCPFFFNFLSTKVTFQRFYKPQRNIVFFSFCH